MQIKRRLTAVEFEATRLLLPSKTEAESIEAARLHLVEGKTYAAIAASMDRSRNMIFKFVENVYRVFENYREAQSIEDSAKKGIPAGWKAVRLIAPGGLVQEFRRQISEYRADAEGASGVRKARAITPAQSAKLAPKKTTAGRTARATPVKGSHKLSAAAKKKARRV